MERWGVYLPFSFLRLVGRTITMQMKLMVQFVPPAALAGFYSPRLLFLPFFSTSYTTRNRAIRWTIYNCESPILVRLTVSFFTLFPGAKRERMREWSLYHEPFNDFSRCGRSVRSFFGSSSRFLIDEEAFFHKAISPFFCPSASYLVNIGMGLVSTKTKGVEGRKAFF